MELGRLPRVRTVANLMRKICYNNKDNLMAGLICGGWDPYEGGQIYEIPLGGTIMRQKFAIGGSGSSYIYGLVDGLYRDNMTKTECQDFVKKCKCQESTSKFCRCILLLNHYLSVFFFFIVYSFVRYFTRYGTRWFIRRSNSIDHYPTKWSRKRMCFRK